MPLSSPGMQNRFMSSDPQGQPEAREMPQQGFQPTPGPAMGPGGPQGPGGPPQPQQPMPTPEEVAVAKAHLSLMVSDISKLVERPTGSLTKKDVFSAASDMLAKGAFSTPAEKVSLIKEMAAMPDDDAGIRKVLGTHLLRAATALASVEHMG